MSNISVDNIMRNRLIRLPEVMKTTHKSRSSIYAGIDDGTFGQPVKTGSRSVAFVEADVYAWVEARIAVQVDTLNR